MESRVNIAVLVTTIAISLSFDSRHGDNRREIWEYCNQRETDVVMMKRIYISRWCKYIRVNIWLIKLLQSLDTTFIIGQSCSMDDFVMFSFLFRFRRLLQVLNFHWWKFSWILRISLRLNNWKSFKKFCTEHSARLTTKKRNVKKEKLYEPS